MSDVIIVTPDIIGPIKNGGIGTACFHYARTLADVGLTVDILFTGPVEQDAIGLWEDFYAARGIRFYTLNSIEPNSCATHGTRWYTDRSWAVMQFLRKRNDRYILFQDWHANGFWSMRAKRMGYGLQNATLGLIAHSCTEWQKAGMQTFGAQPLDESDLAWAERQAIAEADILISPSQHMIDWLMQNGYELPAQTALCPYTFEDKIQVYPQQGPDLDHLIFFGRLETRKGLHLLGRALRGLNPAALPKRVSLLGKYATVEGIPTETYLHELRADLPSITFEVHTNFDYMQAIDYIRRQNGLVVMPSLLDNLPLTVIESITNGIYFIASNVGGIPEMVESRFLFEPTSTSLKAKLAERRDLDFSKVEYLYSPDRARTVWIEHIRSVLASESKVPVAAPMLNMHGNDGVSVCIPFYRHDRYLHRLLASFMRMRRRDLQLVFVNDGTPVSECQRFHQMAEKLTPLGHVFHTQENTGPGGARNKAVSLARYDTILFFDADNVAFPNLVNSLQVALQKSGVDIMAAPFVAVRPMDREPTMADAVFMYRPSGGSLASSLFDNLLGDMCCVTYRRILEKIGGIHASRFYAEDWELFVQAHGRGFRQWVFPEPLFFYTWEEHDRRVQTPKHTNYCGLWSRLEQLDKSVLADLARTMAQEVYVKRFQN